MDRRAISVALWTALTLGAALAWRAAGTPPPRETVVSVLSESAATGRPVRDIVRRRQIRPLDWGRAVRRELADPAFRRDVTQRVAAELEASADRDLPD